MNRPIPAAVVLALALGLAGGIALLIRSDGAGRPVPTADTLRGAMP